MPVELSANTLCKFMQQIENLLLELGGTGNGLHQLARSLAGALEDYEVTQLQLIARLSGKIEGDRYMTLNNDQPQAVEICHWIIARLQARVTAQAQARKRSSLAVSIRGLLLNIKAFIRRKIMFQTILASPSKR